MLPLSTNIREAYKNGKDDEQNFIQNLALFLCTFLREHAPLVEQKVSCLCFEHGLIMDIKWQMDSELPLSGHAPWYKTRFL